MFELNIFIVIIIALDFIIEIMADIKEDIMIFVFEV
jgi:hypothetical protein